MGSEVVSTGIGFQIPRGKQALLVNSSNNTHWVLLNKQTIGAGNHRDIKLLLKNISAAQRRVPPATVLAQVIFQNIVQFKLQRVLSVYNELAIRAGRLNELYLPAGETANVMVLDFEHGISPDLINGNYGVVKGFGNFHESESVFVVPRVYMNTLPFPMVVTVVNSSENGITLRGQIAILDIFVYEVNQVVPA
uniref:Uncharacterized protein n=1 Tax=Ditylenchus dipsaci TaxID=166011 RepID=A0A915DJH6_9BILA